MPAKLERSVPPVYQGYSDDVRPSDAIVGSHFYEIDTGRWYLSTGSQWYLDEARSLTRDPVTHELLRQILVTLQESLLLQKLKG